MRSIRDVGFSLRHRWDLQMSSCYIQPSLNAKRIWACADRSHDNCRNFSWFHVFDGAIHGCSCHKDPFSRLFVSNTCSLRHIVFRLVVVGHT